jgi:2-keto-4-pentenoate hydratase/2-oxohepta-3-ene-1,7-dioic acid hydratase in catechol pathway
MRYVTYEFNGELRVGYLDASDAVVDAGFEGDMVAFIEAGAPFRDNGVVTGAILRAPLRPRTLRDFLAFEGHMLNALSRLGREIPAEWYDTPAYYKGLPDTVIGPEDEIPYPSYTEELDHELEVAVVIGTPGRNIAAVDADAHIFGYTLWNDLSARDTQRRELPVGMGPSKAKDWDGSNVIGPCIATPDEFEDAGAIRLRVRVNGEEWGSDTSANMHHSFADLIAYASLDLTLRSGEVLGSGTAASGSGLELGRFLNPGDLVELQADRIGVLRNRVGPKPARKE